MLNISRWLIWQKRGHNSLHGVVTAVSNGKCIDFHVMSKHCKQCWIWESKKGMDEYTTWKEMNNCNINHTTSSGSMEAVGAKEIYRRTIDKHKLMYSQYLGDGDTSSFKEIVTSNPYKEYGICIIKLEMKSPISGKGQNHLQQQIQGLYHHLHYVRHTQNLHEHLHIQLLLVQRVHSSLRKG